MMLGLRDLHRVKVPLIVTLTALGVAAGLLVASRAHALAAHTRRDTALAAAGDAEARANAAMVDKANIEQYRPTYQLLRANAVIGTEQRLAWIEYFTRQVVRGNPTELSLTIAPRRALEDPPTTPEPLENLQFYASKLTLESKLLHEMDALGLLARLKQVQGASVIRSCRMVRSAEGASAPRPYLLKFDCEGDIVTLDKPPTTPGATQ